MAKKPSKSPATSQPATAEVPTGPQEAGASTTIGKAVEDVLGEIAKVQSKRAGLAGLLAAVEKQKMRLRDAEAEYQAAASVVDQLQADLVAKHPAVAAIFGAPKTPKRTAARKASKAGAPRKGEKTLDLDQANQVLAAMPEQFELGAFAKKARELFSGLSSKGSMELLASKVKDAGGKGMGRKYKKV